MVSANFFTPGPQTYNVTPESPVAPVTPAIGGIAKSVGGLLEGSINTAVKLEQASNRGSGSGPKKEQVAAWSEGIQRIAQLPEAQRPMAYKNFVGEFSRSTGANVGHTAFKSISETFLGQSPQYTLEERIDTAATDAMIKDPEFQSIFNVAKAQNQGKSIEEIVDIASTQYESVNAAKQSIATGEALSGANWATKGEAIATGRMQDLRNYATYSAYDVLQTQGLAGALNALDAHIARVRGEKNSIYAMAVQGGVTEEQLKQFNTVSTNTIDELTSLKELLTNDNTAGAVQKLISEAAGDQVAQAKTIGDLIAVSASLDIKTLPPNMQSHVLKGISDLSKKGVKFKKTVGPDGQEVFTFLGTNATSEGILAAASIVGERAYAPGQAISRSLGAEDLGFQAQRRRIAQAEAQPGAVPPLPPVRPDGVGIDPEDSVSLEDAAKSQSPEAKGLAEKYSRVSSDTVKEMQEWTQLMISAPTGPMTESQANMMSDAAISLSLAAQGEGKKLPYSEGFINKLWNNPNFLANMENLKTFDPQKYDTVKKFVNGHLQYEANVNQQRMRVAAEKISERSSWVKLDPETNRLIVDPEMYSVDARGVVIPRTDTYTNIGRREKVEFLSALMENYGGNITAAALDNYSKLRFTVDGGRTREVNLRVLGLPDARDVKEFIDRQGSYRSVTQAEYNLNKDKLDMVGVSREQYINERQAYATGTFGSLRSIGRAVGEALLGSPAAAAELSPELRDQALSYARQDRPEEVARQVSINSEFVDALRQSESSGRTTAQFTDKQRRSFVGLDQVGEARLTDFNKATGNKYTLNELKGDQGKQDEVALWHYNDHAENIQKRGLDRFIGQTDPKSGSEITLSGMLAVAHLGGMAGLNKYLTDEKYNKADAVGTKLSDYMNRFSGLETGAKDIPLPPRRPEDTSDEDFISQISKALAETPTERRVREAQARQAAKEAYYRSLNQ